MTSKSARRLFPVFAALLGLFLTAIILLVGEVSVRLFTNIQLLGNSANLNAAKRFGDTRGNTPNIEAVSFSAKVFTDASGFRVSNPGYQYPAAPRERILVVGDSVAFGAGVSEPETFVGLLRAKHPDWAIYNSAVIGYGLSNYLDVIQYTKLAKPTKIILVYCLNDLSGAGAEKILRQIALKEGRQAVRKNDPANTVEWLRSFAGVSNLNDFLSTKSELYLLLKGITTDPSRRYFFADYASYARPRTVEKSTALLASLSAKLKHDGIEFLVIISPYEYQLRHVDDETSAAIQERLLPQRLLTRIFRQQGIPYIDATSDFLSSPEPRQKYFLPYDPMHLSVAGHVLMAQFIDRAIAAK